MELKKIQEAFIDIYFSRKEERDVDRFIEAVKEFELNYGLRAPYLNYQSFKSRMTIVHTEMRRL